MSWVSGLISGAANLIGGGISALTGKQAGDREYERQKEFARSGIRWRVEDAKAAGIHPIFAIGANTSTYSPQAAVGMDYGVSQMGQNIGRAIEAKQTASERAEAQAVASEVGRAQADYYRAAAANQQAQADLTGQRSVTEALSDIGREFTGGMGARSDRVLRTQPGQPPSMPTTDWKHHVPRGDNMFQWMSGSRPDVYHFMPGNDFSQLFEDKGWILEKGALASAAITYLGGRADDQTLDGMKYFEEVGGWVPIESKLYRQLMEDRHVKSRVDYGPDRYRSIRDTPMRNWR